MFDEYRSFLLKKEAFAKSERERINTEKQKENTEKAANALQAAIRAGNIDKVRIEEKA